jgi:hypothetical protein
MGVVVASGATFLGSIMDPGSNAVDYKRRLLGKLRPYWKPTDPSAKPAGWEDRCVSGTGWENLDPFLFRVHNRSMNCVMEGVTNYGSRLHNDSTANLSCEVRVSCGCRIVAPFAWIFEAITAVKGSSLGGNAATIQGERIVLRDGLGLVQVGDAGKAFNLVAYHGEVTSYKLYAKACRKTRDERKVLPKLPWPQGRALVREEFTHGIKDSMRDYGYVPTGGSGNLLICRNTPISAYKIVGVCIDEHIQTKKGGHIVTIR